mmetsp:Transcript_17135/g.36954  ORF Transcript_17135/g.36954 Transcript_17135/m.36954 type:complete len:90 (+) Transcript_17135:130-399(+)
MITTEAAAASTTAAGHAQRPLHSPLQQPETSSSASKPQISDHAWNLTTYSVLQLASGRTECPGSRRRSRGILPLGEHVNFFGGVILCMC